MGSRVVYGFCIDLNGHISTRCCLWSAEVGSSRNCINRIEQNNK